MVGAGAVCDLFGHFRHRVVGVHWHDGKWHCAKKVRTILRATCVPIATLVPGFKNEGSLAQQMMVGSWNTCQRRSKGSQLNSIPWSQMRKLHLVRILDMMQRVVVSALTRSNTSVNGIHFRLQPLFRNTPDNSSWHIMWVCVTYEAILQTLIYRGQPQ